MFNIFFVLDKNKIERCLLHLPFFFILRKRKQVEQYDKHKNKKYLQCITGGGHRTVIERKETTPN